MAEQGMDDFNKKHAQLKQLLATWKEGTYSQVGDIPIEVSVGENFVEEIEEAPEDDNTQETPLQDDYAQDENTQEDVMNPPNLNGVSLPHPTKKRGRPKGSNKSVIGLPRKRFRTNMIQKLVLKRIEGSSSWVCDNL